jgi:hypothetical protein
MLIARLDSDSIPMIVFTHLGKPVMRGGEVGPRHCRLSIVGRRGRQLPQHVIRTRCHMTRHPGITSLSRDLGQKCAGASVAGLWWSHVED